MKDTFKVNSISKLHELLGYPTKPAHPLITLIDFSKVKMIKSETSKRYILGFYLVSLKKLSGAGFKYGRKDYDFSEASLLCMAPEQLSIVTNVEVETYPEGWGLYFHPDLIRSSFLNDKIKDYSFFSYDMNEALHLSDKEKNTLYAVVETIKEEFSINLDNHSHDLIISNIEVLLNYCKRFYGRQFITRSHHNKGVAAQFEKLVADYFDSEKVKINGLPSVKYCAEQLHLSANYLGDLLKQETGKSAIEHIHYHLIEKAKNLLLNSSESISEIAYELGFEQPQNFSKLFKKKTNMSPAEYRSTN
ncbi:AraC family transcriptional regulator [Puteibacter caeruleilacunae]|nr:AraC family transcriptional regulator [Puteibacter caeruleilacunae]